MRFKQFLEVDQAQKYWGSKGAGILVICPKTKRILVAMRSMHVNEPNTYGVVGGKIDNPEVDIRQEAKREFQEETGYTGSLQLMPAYIFQDGQFEYHNFIGLVPEEFQPRTNWETSYFKWITLEELLKLEPKHFGLSALITHSLPLIQKYAA